jgi:peptide/nickel transport system ATP-binding protein
LLEIRNLHIEGHYEDAWHPLIKGIDLTLQRGEVLGLIGESGQASPPSACRPWAMCVTAAKSPAARCISMASTCSRPAPSPAQAAWLAHRLRRAERGGFVQPGAPADRSACGNRRDQWRHDRAQAKTEAVELYRVLRLPDPEQIGQRYPHQVSGGQLQRVMTAMAMACHPDLIIFDEPTTALDVTTQIEVLAAIRDAVKTFGSAALYISHDLAVVAQMADRIMVLRHGSLVEEAQTRKMLGDPQEDYTKSLWAVRNFRTEPKACPQQEQPLLELRNSCASYGRQPVLHDVSLKLYRGQTLAVIGESGSGKHHGTTDHRFAAADLGPGAV